jgi:hypothetical protein
LEKPLSVRRFPVWSVHWIPYTAFRFFRSAGRWKIDAIASRALSGSAPLSASAVIKTTPLAASTANASL